MNAYRGGDALAATTRRTITGLAGRTSRAIGGKPMMALRMFGRGLVLTLLAGATAAAAAPALPGAPIFAQNCAACHQATGKGIPGAFPALAGDAFVVGDPARPVAVLLNGRGVMPTFRDVLSDAQIAQVLSYVRASWGNKAAAVDPKLVTRLRGVKMAPLKSTMPAAH